MTQPSEPSNDSADSGAETSAGDASGADEESTAPKGVELSVDQLSPEALRGLIEEYITREGTDYGHSGDAQGAATDPHSEWSLEEKVAQVLRQLESGDARIVFDLEQESASIVPADELSAHLAGVD
jgi:uncharacterized protein YheU (UPF0270 family)